MLQSRVGRIFICFNLFCTYLHIESYPQRQRLWCLSNDILRSKICIYQNLFGHTHTQHTKKFLNSHHILKKKPTKKLFMFIFILHIHMLKTYHYVYAAIIHNIIDDNSQKKNNHQQKQKNKMHKIEYSRKQILIDKKTWLWQPFPRIKLN